MVNVREIDVVNYKFDSDKEEYTPEDIQHFILRLCDNDQLLDKRISSIFTSNSWLYKYTTKEDVRQDILVALLSSATNKLPYITGEDRMKYFNTVVSNIVCTILKDNYNVIDTALSRDFVCNSVYNMGDEENEKKVGEIFDLFVGEHLERQLLELYYEGYTDKEMKEILNLGRHSFEKIRSEIRKKLIDNGYHYLEEKED